MPYLRSLGILAVTLVGAALLAMSGSAAGSGAVVKVGQTNLGRVLVDAHGKTLYIWAHDRSTKSTCYGQCAAFWPAVLTHAKPRALSGARAGLIGTSRRRDGRMQATYAGHPLYYFVQDRKPGQTKGEGLTGFGGRWDPISAAGKAVRKQSGWSGYSYAPKPLKANIISPAPRARAGVGGTFTVDLSLQARNRAANSLLAGYTAGFNDPNSASFHPGPDQFAPGLVVLLSTTPTIADTPLHGPKTNLAGVFQINDVSRVKGLKRSFNSWIVTAPGFFGKGVQATLTVYAVRGVAPAVVTGHESPISNVVREAFTIAG